jgi:hypothetical protein
MVLSPVSAVSVPVRTSTYAPTDKTPTTHVNNDKTSRTLNCETSSLYTSNTHPNPNPFGPTINLLNNESIYLEFNRPSTVLSCPIPVRITNRNVTKLQHSTKQANTANLTNVKLLPLIGTCTTKYDFGPSVLLANTMSLLPKIDEVRCVIHWPFLEDVESCEVKLQLLVDLITVGIDTIMPLKRIQLHVNDPPWVTLTLKN